MNLFRYFRITIPLVLLLLFPDRVSSDDLEKSGFTSIVELIGKGMLHAHVMGAGGHEGECIHMLLENPSDDSTFVWLEPGRVLNSLDTTVQDILITREEMLVLAPGEQRMINLFGFCSQASNASPDSAEMFRVGEMADSAVVVLAEFLNERNNEFPEDAIQEAVWCLTDDRSVEGIYSEDLASIADLRSLVASLKAKDEKWIAVEDTPYDDGRFSHYTTTITGEFELFIPTDCMVDIYICDPENRRIDDFERRKPYKAGSYDYNFRLVVTNWPRGEYTLYIRADGKLLYEKKFEL